MTLIHEKAIETVHAAYQADLLQTTYKDAVESEHYSVHPNFAYGYTALSRLYQSSAFGQYHATQVPRYMGHYPYNPRGNYSQALTDLGDDIDPVLHMQYTHDAIAIPFLKAEVLRLQKRERLNAYTVPLIRLAALTHDIGECTHPLLGQTVGDISYGDHTPEDKHQEVKVWDRVVDETGIRSVLPAHMVPTIQRIVANSEDSEVGNMFDIIERIGYYTSAGRAAYVSLSIDRRTTRRHTLEHLAQQVGSHHEEHILESGSPFAKEVVSELQPIFDTVRARVARRALRMRTVIA